MTNEYFLWLCDLISPSDRYRNLLYILYSIPFYWSILWDDDRNTDGLRLRDIYLENTPVNNNVTFPFRESTVLEVIISIAIYIEDQVMHDPLYGDRTSEWFWMMIGNLGLTGRIKNFSDPNWDEETDPKWVSDIVDIWLSRHYDTNGFGGLFPLKKVSQNQQKVSLFYQMHAFLQENYGVGNL